MARTRTTAFEAAAYLRSDADIRAYLEAALEDGDPGVVAGALGDIARVKGMTEVAHAAGLGRESMYKTLSKHGNPAFDTVNRVLRSLGFRLRLARRRR